MIKRLGFFVNDEDDRGPYLDVSLCRRAGQTARPVGRTVCREHIRALAVDHWKECAERGERKRSTTSTAAG
jgi:hypothetical protein